MSSDDEGMSSVPLSDEELSTTSTSAVLKKKVRINKEGAAMKPVVAVKEPVKRKYVRKTPASKVVTAGDLTSNINHAWELVKKSYTEGSAVIVLIPPATGEASKK